MTAPVVQAANVVTLAPGTAVRVSVMDVMGPLVAVETSASVRLVMVAVSAQPARSAVSYSDECIYSHFTLFFFSQPTASVVHYASVLAALITPAVLVHVLDAMAKIVGVTRTSADVIK